LAFETPTIFIHVLQEALENVSKSCDNYVDEAVNFYQDDTLLFLAVLIGRATPAPPSDNRFLLGYAWHELIFEQPPDELVDFLDCVVVTSSPKQDTDDEMSLGGASSACFQQSDVMTREEWLALVERMKQGSICTFLEQQQRKIEFAEKESKNFTQQHLNVLNNCPLGA